MLGTYRSGQNQTPTVIEKAKSAMVTFGPSSQSGSDSDSPLSVQTELRGTVQTDRGTPEEVSGS
ncbi:hypothetical protein [Haloquadratum walsbyi]|uniref:hypothetical protein n=1 Tax=Haloquadratum walsbyi TaxID=293091 RepID=UPI0026D6D2E2|nr:hypothetical protein [Haloquadratum walsbyi]